MKKMELIRKSRESSYTEFYNTADRLSEDSLRLCLILILILRHFPLNKLNSEVKSQKEETK